MVRCEMLARLLLAGAVMLSASCTRDEAREAKTPSPSLAGTGAPETSRGSAKTKATRKNGGGAESAPAAQSTGAGASGDGQSISYTLSVPKPSTHYVAVRARIPTRGRDRLPLMMAVWTPGSYLIRDYPRHLEGFAARAPDGTALPWQKVEKHRWRVSTKGHPFVVVSYELYAHEMSVRHNWVAPELGVLNGAPTFITDPEHLEVTHRVRLMLPPDWDNAVTGLPRAPGTAPEAHTYLASSYAELVDSPIVAGAPDVQDFEVAGTPHQLVSLPAAKLWDFPRAAADVEAIVRTQQKFWGGELPYARYIFMNLVTNSWGGLEHRNSTLMMTSPYAYKRREHYLAWLGLVSHEFFHTWNVKRLRPVSLRNYDFERENYTRALWMVEGITSYYDDLLVHRAGLSERDEYLERLSKNIQRVQTRPGRKVQSLQAASFDAWIKHYQPDENSPNTTISYYAKGAVVAFLLDARIRAATGGHKSLDDVMRLMYGRYAQKGFAPQDFAQAVETVANRTISPWLQTVTATTKELDYGPALEWWGLRFRPAEPAERKTATGADRGPTVHLGIETETRDGRLLVDAVLRGQPAWHAGVSVGDELIALDGYRLGPRNWRQRLALYTAGDQVTLLVARRDVLRSLTVELAPEPRDTWALEVAPDTTPAQTRRRKAWLSGR